MARLVGHPGQSPNLPGLRPSLWGLIPGTRPLPPLTRAPRLSPPLTLGHFSPDLFSEDCEILLVLAKVGPGLGVLTPPRLWHLP